MHRNEKKRRESVESVVEKEFVEKEGFKPGAKE